MKDRQHKSAGAKYSGQGRVTGRAPIAACYQMCLNDAGPREYGRLRSERNENPFFGSFIVFDGRKAPKFGDQQVANAEDHQTTRRDFIYYATTGAGAVIAGAAVWPLVNSMNPSADVLALASMRVPVDLSLLHI